MRVYDLHTHSTASDGVLAPSALIERAKRHGVDTLALTDHDTIGGIAEAREAAAEGIRLIAGVEISVSWRGHLIHVVGLGIDESDSDLILGLESLRDRRDDRAEQMAMRLEKAGIRSALEGARRYQTTEILSRTHFARYLVEAGKVDSVDEAFKRFLNAGTPGHVPMQWATLPETIDWITGAGGAAVVAHPGRYRIDENQLDQLLEDFVEAGGIGIEVVCSNQKPDQIERFAGIARKYGLQASAGSDFHSPKSNRELGRLAPLPEYVIPVWKNRDW
jgi:predicted metal-dependent phosphoesterase TrpH